MSALWGAVNFANTLSREIGVGEIPRWCGRAARVGAAMGLMQGDDDDDGA